ncbi:PSD1 and planctomycete cytochrome C domain-containing protein [Planctomicrobium sp.]|nr:PSD1 and planctomycete cytochrome C domain-containing protein [Planctomicrobium sp.]MDA7527541.1 PSD1 and planctomycete cytochrome C domain-containing protein [bacterium]MDB4732818.1 PSD1 and planctomycete cytochrome C domain-containing protein [Planctomicrobium sp.]
MNVEHSRTAASLTKSLCQLILFTVIGLFGTNKAIAEPSSNLFFDEQIAPLLATRCLSCHNESEKKGGLNLSREATARAGGENGATITPGTPDQSLLWEKISTDEMPPEHPLSQAEKELVRQWISNGAKWGTDRIDPFRFSTDDRAGYDWWSLQPVELPEVPKVSQANWARNEIDQFVLSKLESSGLQPSPQADGRTLLRRLYFDVIGLPPILKQESGKWKEETLGIEIDFDSFASSPESYSNVVDALLASPHYGERWGRHWLDVIRFGESQGFERNWVRPNAWRYRDWVIQALNSDMPYDEFLRQQIAGDALYPDDLDSLIATGYLVCGTYDMVGYQMGSAAMKKSVRHDELEDMVAAVGQSLLGLTINCARCHDHKFDPISQREYYQVSALLGGVTQAAEERKDIKLKSSAGAPFEGAAHVVISQQPPPFHILNRGNSRDPGEVVSPQGIRAFSTSGLSGDFGLSSESTDAERRVALAKWITDSRNPLTPRVIVNRLWHYHFGLGIVDSPSDFGYSGGRPSHPELLDWLAKRFVNGGWKLKNLHRLILNSATYQQASNVHNTSAEEIDGDNRLLWRSNSRRLDGESTRDAMLSLSGALNRAPGGPSFYDMQAKLETNHTFPDPKVDFNDEVNRRTVYRLWARCGSNPLLESLDCPDPSVMLPRRLHTITPMQSLSLLNNPFIEYCSKRLSNRIQNETPEDVDQQIGQLYRLLLLRVPKPRELELARTFVQKQKFQQLCLVMFNTNEFLFVE